MLKLPSKSLVVSALFALSLTAGASQAIAEQDGIVYKQVSSSDSSYCHIKYMAFTAESLRTGALEFEPSDVIDRYGPCNFDPKSQQEVQNQLIATHRGLHGDGSNDSSSDSSGD